MNRAEKAVSQYRRVKFLIFGIPYCDDCGIKSFLNMRLQSFKFRRTGDMSSFGLEAARCSRKPPHDALDFDGLCITVASQRNGLA